MTSTKSNKRKCTVSPSTPYLDRMHDEVRMVRHLSPEKLGDIIQFATMHLLERDEPDPFNAQTIISHYRRYKGTPYGVYLRKAFFALTGGYSVTTQMHMIEKDPEHEFLGDWIDIVDNPDLDPYIAHAIDTGTMVLDYLSKCDMEDAAKAFYMVLEWLTGYETIDDVLLMHS